MNEYPELTKALFGFTTGVLFAINVLVVKAWLEFLVSRWPK